jgi:hypothetical protein
MTNQRPMLCLVLGCVVGFLLGSFAESMLANKQLTSINDNLGDINKELAQGIRIRTDIAAIGGTPILLHRNRNGDAVIGTLPDNAADTDIHPLYFFDQSTTISP